MKNTSKFLITITLASFSLISYANWQLVSPEASNPKILTTIQKSEITTAKVADNLELGTNKNDYQSNELIELTYSYTNKTNSDQVAFDLTLAENNQFLAEDSVLFPDSTEFTLTIDNQQLHWQWELAKPQLSFTDFDNDFFGYLPLQETFDIPARSCGATCVNEGWPWNVNFIFQGEETHRIYLTKAGQLFFSDPNKEYNNDTIENHANISALFSNNSHYDNELRIAEITPTDSDRQFVVFEWTHLISANIQQRYQVIIEEHTSNIWFNYLDVVDTDESTQAGAVNSSGLVSFDILNSTSSNLINGLPPQQNNTVKLINEKGGQVSLTTNIKLNELTLPLAETQYTTAEEQQVAITAEIDNLVGTVTINHNNSNRSSISSELAMQTTKVNVVLAEQAQVAVNEENLPMNGNLVVAGNNSLTYTPNKDFFGDDSFIFNIVDDYVSAKSGLTNIIVTPVNDAPTVIITSNTEIEIAPKTQVVLTAQITDVDSSMFTIHWQQVTGPEVSFTIIYDENGNGQSILFSAPSPTPFPSVPLRFSVRVDDGQAQSSATIDLSVKNDSGGSFGYMLFLVFITMFKTKKR